MINFTRTNETLAGGEERRFNKGGNFLYFTNAPGSFQLKFDDGQFLDWEDSLGFSGVDSTFQSFTIRNIDSTGTNNASTNFRIISGFGDFFLQTATTVTLDAASLAALESIDLNAATLDRIAGRAALTDGSGTITTGGTAQTAIAANASRNYLLIHNADDTDLLWFNIATTAVEDQPSIALRPQSSFTFEGRNTPPGLVSVIGPTTGQEFSVKEA